MPATERGIALQQDTITNVDGGPVRVLQGTAIINGVPTNVQMQVVVLADADGRFVPAQPDNTAILLDTLAVLKDIRTLLSFQMGLSVTDQTTTPVTPGISL